MYDPTSFPFFCSLEKWIRIICFIISLMGFRLCEASTGGNLDGVDQVIQEVYQKELGRAPDPEGLRHHRQIMEIENRNREWLTRVLSESREGQQYRTNKRLRRWAYGLVGCLLLIAGAVGVLSPDSPAAPVTRGWIWLTFTAFLLRGIAVLCITPPLEGIDEYQHIAVLQFRLENGRAPIYGQDYVPSSLLPHLKSYPHPDYSWQQLKAHGVLRYRHFYTLDPGTGSPPMPALYQAQHPPLYYWFTAPLYNVVSRTCGILSATYTLRILNLFMGFGGLLLLLSPMYSIWKDQRVHLLITLVAGMSPMFLPYIARVANDPLALLFCGLATYTLFSRTCENRRLWMSLITGVFIGLGVLTKLIALVLLPAGLLLLLYRLILRMQPARLILLQMACMILGFFLVALPFILWSLNTYHVPFPAQETIQNKAAGYGFSDLLSQIHPDHIRIFLYERMIAGNLWTSGWSFLQPNQKWTQFMNIFLLSGIIAGGAGWCNRFFQVRKFPSPSWVFCGLLSAGALSAAYVHALNSILTWGVIATPSHYIMVALPALTVLLAACTDGVARRFTLFYLVALWGVLPAVELQSLLFRAVPYWSQLHLNLSAFRRLGELTPGWLPWWGFPGLYFLSLLLQLGLIIGTFTHKNPFRLHPETG